jgi:hypothetical protein
MKELEKRIRKIQRRVKRRTVQSGGADYDGSGNFGNTVNMTVNFITHAVKGGILLVDATLKAIDVGVDLYDDLARSSEPTPSNPNPSP